MRTVGSLVVAAVAVAAVLAGCATKPSPQRPPEVTASANVQPTVSARTRPDTSTSPSEGARPQPNKSVAMPWSDGGPALWPLPWDNGAEGQDGDTRPIQLLGFLDAFAREVVPPKYASFDYCLTGDRPTRLVALREGAIDLVNLDGVVALTIKIPADADGLILWCDNNKSVATRDLGGAWNVYDLATGKPAKVSTFPDDTECRELPDPDSGPEAPEGYPTNALEGWWSDAEGDKEATKYFYPETGAVVEPPSTVWHCSGDSGYLNCFGRLNQSVYDRNGKLTDFANVGGVPFGDCNDTRLPELPYLWATAGGVQGYIDRNNTWRYQTSVYTSVNGD